MANEIEDALVRPLGEVLARVGEGIAQAQAAMDRASLATETAIANDPALREAGLSATWYAMPEVTVELKMSLALRTESRTQAGKVVQRRHSLWAAPFNATIANAAGSEVQGQSVLRARIVAIPPGVRASGEG
jgi:hypothetical protein